MFFVASAAITAVAAIVLSGVLTSSLRHQVLADREVSLTEFVAAVVRRTSSTPTASSLGRRSPG